MSCFCDKSEVGISKTNQSIIDRFIRFQKYNQLYPIVLYTLPLNPSPNLIFACRCILSTTFMKNQIVRLNDVKKGLDLVVDLMVDCGVCSCWQEACKREIDLAASNFVQAKYTYEQLRFYNVRYGLDSIDIPTSPTCSRWEVIEQTVKNISFNQY